MYDKITLDSLMAATPVRGQKPVCGDFCGLGLNPPWCRSYRSHRKWAFLFSMMGG
jgi:hypothetical protein